MKYRTALITGILLLNFPFLSLAQNRGKWSVLFHGDIIMTNINGKSSSYNTGAYLGNLDYAFDTYGGKRLQLGWEGGIGAQYIYTNHILFQASINYSAEGGAAKLNWLKYSDIDIPPFTINGTMHFRLSYLTVPVTIGYKFNGIKHFYPSAGLYYGYLLTAIAQGEYNVVGGSEHFKEEIMKDYFRNDIGYCAGLNYVIPLKKLNHFIVDFKYSHSLFSIGSTKINPRPNAYNQMFSLGLAYEFTL